MTHDMREAILRDITNLRVLIRHESEQWAPIVRREARAALERIAAWADAQKAPQPRTAEPAPDAQPLVIFNEELSPREVKLVTQAIAARDTWWAAQKAAPAEPAPAPADEPPPLPEPVDYGYRDEGGTWVQQHAPKIFRAAEYALEQAARAASPVPAGWKLVPVEPTSDMLYAMAEQDGWRRGDREHPMLTRWEDYWRSALAASPASPAQPPTPQPPQGAQQEPLTAQQLDALIEGYVGGAELADGEYASMVMFAAAVERAHGIGQEGETR
jgi:hypothetical protein